MLLATSLVLASACLHALWNVLLKRARDLHAASLGILALSVLITWAMVPWTRGPLIPGRAALAWTLGAGIGEGCYFVLLACALEAAPLGWSYAWMRGVGMLLVWPVSVLLLGEPLRTLAALSVGVVCLGLALLGRAPARGQGSRSFLWAAAAGVAIAGFTLCYKAALVHGAHPVMLYATAMLVALPIQTGIRIRRLGWRAGLVLPETWRAVPPRSCQPGLVLCAGILCAASFLLYLEALDLAGAGAMATLRNTSIVFAVLLSRAFGVLAERPTCRQWAGAALVTAGAVGLAWGR